jgi:hypothetical protein
MQAGGGVTITCPLVMYCFIDIGYGRGVRAPIAKHPRSLEMVIVVPAAFTTRSMPCRQRRCLVQEEELRVTAWLHQGLSIAPLVRQQAGYPRLSLPPADDCAVGVMKRASIAQPSCEWANRLNFTCRQNTVW